MRMPRWFIETPSETEIVVNGTGARLRRGDAEPRRIGLRSERHRARRVLAVLADDADEGLAEVVLVGHAGRAQERAVRRAVEPLGDERGAQLLRGVVMRSSRWVRITASIDASQVRPSASAALERAVERPAAELRLDRRLRIEADARRRAGIDAAERRDDVGDRDGERRRRQRALRRRAQRRRPPQGGSGWRSRGRARRSRSSRPAPTGQT